MPEDKKVQIVEGTSTARRSLFFGSIGEVMEWFDFMVYVSLAPVLAKVFFAAGSESSLLVTLGIFGAAFLARRLAPSCSVPRVGRRHALAVSALLMAAAKLVEGLLPTL